MRKLSLIIILLISTLSFAQNKPKLIDLSKTDITTLSDFDGAQVAFRNLHLGMNKSEALAILNSFSDLTWKFDGWNTKSENPESTEEMRIYASLTKKEGMNDPTVLYLIWDKGSKGLSSLVFYKACTPFLQGNTPQLFNIEALDPNSEYRKFLHTTPTTTTNTIGIQTLAFKEQHFTLISMVSEGKNIVWFKFEK